MQRGWLAWGSDDIVWLAVGLETAPAGEVIGAAEG